MNDAALVALVEISAYPFQRPAGLDGAREDRRRSPPHQVRIFSRRRGLARRPPNQPSETSHDHTEGQWPRAQIDADPDTPLLYVLRDDLRLNAAKFGCGLGQCGACTVIVDGKAMFSCVTPMLLLDGKQVTTIEGLGTMATPAPLQQAFIDEQAAQCGYCIPGMIMRAQALLERNPEAERRRDPRRAGAQSLPLRHPHAHPARGAARRGGCDAAAATPGNRRERAMIAPCSSTPPLLAGGGALIVSFSLPAHSRRTARRRRRPKLPGSLRARRILDAWIRIDADGGITVFTGKAELGQGIKTAIQQIAAEELDVPVEAMELVTADTSCTPNEGYTAGSQSMQNSGSAIRNAAAQVRAMLIAEAAKRFDCRRRTLKAENGTVIAPDGRAAYGDLVADDMLHVQAQPRSR